MPGYISSAFFTTRSHPRHNRIPAQTVLSPVIFITGGDYLKTKNVLAIDLGDSSGRVILISSDGKQIELKEIHRFPNSGIHIGDRIYTDILYLFQELITGMRKAFQATDSIDAFDIDSWGVDFILLDSSGELVVNPYHYRDSQANGMIRKGGLFSLTGFQNIWYNTVYQLLGIQKRNPRILNNAQKFLMIATAQHDSASVAYAVPADEDSYIFINSGTWPVMESLALKYGECADELGQITGHNIRTLYLLGGDSQNPTFCKYIANATKRTVLAGPVEATAAENGLIQLRALGCIDPDIPVSKIIRNSFQISQYKPENTAAWDAQYQKYKKLCTNKHI